MTDPKLPFELGVIALGNNAFEGYNNCYVLGLEADAETTLIDTAIPRPGTEQELKSGLESYGTSIDEIDRILITHHHGDHSGLAGRIQARSGCSVHVHTQDAPLVEQDPYEQAETDDTLEYYLDHWDVPTDKQDELLSFRTRRDTSEYERPTVTTFEDGEQFNLGSIELTAVHLPGHSAGLCGFECTGRDGLELFSGDALLPYYTPNVGGADTRVEQPLTKYLNALSRIIDQNYARAWPGHRGPIIDPTGRAADIIFHHRERTERVIRVLNDGPATAWEVSAALFGSLSSIHIMHGPGEAFAHLDHLQDSGVVSRDGKQYELVDQDPDLDTLFPDVSAFNPLAEV